MAYAVRSFPARMTLNGKPTVYMRNNRAPDLEKSGALRIQRLSVFSDAAGVAELVDAPDLKSVGR